MMARMFKWLAIPLIAVLVYRFWPRRRRLIEVGNLHDLVRLGDIDSLPGKRIIIRLRPQ